MITAEMKAIIENHTSSVAGRRHRFGVQWIALEPRWGSRGARYLLAVDLFPEDSAGTPETTLHILTRAATTRAQLLGLVDDAVHEYLGKGAVARESTEMLYAVAAQRP